MDYREGRKMLYAKTWNEGSLAQYIDGFLGASNIRVRPSNGGPASVIGPIIESEPGGPYSCSQWEEEISMDETQFMVEGGHGLP